MSDDRLKKSGFASSSEPLDVITIGRSSVDLYGEQVGGRLEDMLSFRKYVGGSPANMAIGASRLGLRAGLITKVGDEHMGRYIRELLVSEGVDVTGVVTDPERLTALVLLGIRDEEAFPLIFYRENCADMALQPDDIDPAFVSQAKAVVATGTHLSAPATAAACQKAWEAVREAGGRAVLDIDYRPNLWGLAGHEAGEERFIASRQVTESLQGYLPLLDLVVGTEEEIHIAGGSSDTLEALRAVRERTEATIVCKRGTLGATVFTGEIPADLDDGISVPGLEIEVFNVLGAGDGFMAGLLRGWIRGESWETSLRWANICGAFAVSRHGCAPSYPTWDELEWFLQKGSSHKALRKDADLEHVHWATTRKGSWPQLRAFAFDHRSQLEDMASAAEAAPERIGLFKRLCVRAAVAVADGRAGYGILCDGRLGRLALFDAAEKGLWIGRPVEKPGTKPLRFEVGPDLGSELGTWPGDHVAKVLCRCHPDDSEQTMEDQTASLQVLFDACRRSGHEMLLEIILDRSKPVDHAATAVMMERFYDRGIRPDWWKLEPSEDERSWREVERVIGQRDPLCRGVVVLGLEAEVAAIREAFAAARSCRYVRGFAIGRTIFAAVAQDWFAGRMDDEEAVAAMTERFKEICALWDAGAGKEA